MRATNGCADGDVVVVVIADSAPYVPPAARRVVAGATARAAEAAGIDVGGEIRSGR
jgi:hypothetical protein